MTGDPWAVELPVRIDVQTPADLADAIDRLVESGAVELTWERS